MQNSQPATTAPKKTTEEHLKGQARGALTIGLTRVARRVSLGDIAGLAATPGFRKAT